MGDDAFDAVVQQYNRAPLVRHADAADKTLEGGVAWDVAVETVHNGKLSATYEKQRSAVGSRIGKDVHEVYAFHGTKADCVPKIVAGGFIPSKTGWYGTGVYVTPSAKLAAHYSVADKTNGVSKIVAVKVLVHDGERFPFRDSQAFCICDERRVLPVATLAFKLAP